MTQQLYNIGGHTYLVEAYDANFDMRRNPMYRRFVMLRNFTLMNDVISDTDIYIIEESVFQDFIKEIHNIQGIGHTMQSTAKLAFPIPGSSITAYSDLYSMFNNDLKDYSLFENYDDATGMFDYGTDVYPLIDRDGNMKDIKCDLIRIYHPITEKKLNALIYIDCYLSDIHFHLFCRPYSCYSTNSTTEIRKYNNIYSEYIEVLFPNISDLFGFNSVVNGAENFNVYYEENLNTVISSQNDSFIKKISIQVGGKTRKYSVVQDYDPTDVERYIATDDAAVLVQRVPLNLLIQPFRIVEEIDPWTKENHNVKLYLKHLKTIENNYLTYPFNITIFPYDYVDDATHMYIMSTTKNVVANTFFKEYAFSLQARPGFTDGHFSIITTFDYPRKDDWIQDVGDSKSALRAAYKFYYNVSENDYRYFWVVRLRNEMPEEEALLLEEIDNHWDDEFPTDSGVMLDKNNHWYKWKRLITDDGMETYESKDEVADDEKLRRIINANFNGIKDELKDWEIEDDYDTDMDFIGYRIRIASDGQLKNIIYDTTITAELDSLDDFSFDINDIFRSWDEVPENVICLTQFIDRITGTIFTSNMIALNKEQIKYMIARGFSTIWQLNRTNEDMREIVFNSDIESKKQMLNDSIDGDINRIKELCQDSDLKGPISAILASMKDKYNQYLDATAVVPFNFIDSLNFVTTSETTNELHNSSNTNKRTVLFKPIFFKTFDLQNIQLRSGVTQNIGINLGQYLTKVTTFKLKINDLDFIESSRNDVYVIFQINSNMIIGGSGTYNITNQDDEYISSGSWILY